jgi:hypothetical protein
VVLEEEPRPVVKQSVTPLTLSGSFWTRYEAREGYEEHVSLTNSRLHREGDTFVYRARLGIETHPVNLGQGQTVRVKLSPQAYGTHSIGAAPGTETIGDGYDMGVYEAYVELATREFILDVGRFRMNYGDAMVIGDLDWHEAARAFQGGRIRFKGRKGYYTDIFATLISEGSLATAGLFEGDRYFYGIYSGLGPLLGDLDFDVYLLSQTFGSARNVVVDATATPPTMADQEGASFFTLGSRVNHELEMWDYRLEAGLQAGTTRVIGGDALDHLAWHADMGFGVKPIKPLRFGIGGLAASGDRAPNDGKSDGWDQLFPTAHKFLGLADVFGARTNALSGNVDVSYKATDALVLQAQAHVLARLEAVNGENYAGTEIDAHVIHPIGDGVKLRGMYGLFLPNEDYWNGDALIHYFETQFGYDF